MHVGCGMLDEGFVVWGAVREEDCAGGLLEIRDGGGSFGRESIW